MSAAMSFIRYFRVNANNMLKSANKINCFFGGFFACKLDKAMASRKSPMLEKTAGKGRSNRLNTAIEY